MTNLSLEIGQVFVLKTLNLTEKMIFVGHCGGFCFPSEYAHDPMSFSVAGVYVEVESLKLQAQEE